MSRSGPTGHKDSQRRQKALQEERRRRQDADMRAVLSTPEGRRFFFRLLDGVCNLHGGTFTGNSQTFHLEGRRSVGVELLKEAQGVAPEAWALALQEQMALQRDDVLWLQQARDIASQEPDE